MLLLAHRSKSPVPSALSGACLVEESHCSLNHLLGDGISSFDRSLEGGGLDRFGSPLLPMEIVGRDVFKSFSVLSFFLCLLFIWYCNLLLSLFWLIIICFFSSFSCISCWNWWFCCVRSCIVCLSSLISRSLFCCWFNKRMKWLYFSLSDKISLLEKLSTSSCNKKSVIPLFLPIDFLAREKETSWSVFLSRFTIKKLCLFSISCCLSFLFSRTKMTEKENFWKKNFFYWNWLLASRALRGRGPSESLHLWVLEVSWEWDRLGDEENERKIEKFEK